MEDWLVAWDDPDNLHGNVAHIAEHGLTTDEVEDVMLDRANPLGTSDSTGRPCRFGYTTTGRYIVVIWDWECDSPPVVSPVTAYDVPEPT